MSDKKYLVVVGAVIPSQRISAENLQVLQPCVMVDLTSPTPLGFSVNHTAYVGIRDEILADWTRKLDAAIAAMEEAFVKMPGLDTASCELQERAKDLPLQIHDIKSISGRLGIN
jgi:hypothetical protein